MKVFFYNDTFIPQLVAFLRKVWNKDITESSLIEKRKREMSENPYAREGKFPIVIAMKDDQIIGHHAGTPSKLWVGEKEVLSHWLAGLHVLPEGRRQGVAKALQNITNQLPLATSFWVIEATLKVKRKMGWTIVGKIPDYIKILNPEKTIDSIDFDNLSHINKVIQKIFSNKKGFRRAFFQSIIKTHKVIFNFFISKRLIKNDISQVKEFDVRLDRLWDKNKYYLKHSQVRKSDYLNWKFKYEEGWIKIIAENKSDIIGYAILSQKKVEKVKYLKNLQILSIIDIFWDFEQSEVLWDLLQYIENMGRINNASLLICSINNKTARNILIRNGYYRIPGTVYFGFHCNDNNLNLSPELSKWFITRGDADAAGTLGQK